MVIKLTDGLVYTNHQIHRISYCLKMGWMQYTYTHNVRKIKRATEKKTVTLTVRVNKA